MRFLLLLSLLSLSLSLSLFGDSSNPALATVQVIYGENSFSFASKTFYQRSLGEVIEGLALEIDEEDRKADNINFFDAVTSRSLEVGSQKDFLLLDSRLVENCQFGFKYFNQTGELALTLKGNEQYIGRKYDVLISYTPEEDVNVIKAINEIATDCKIRNLIISTSQHAYHAAAIAYFKEKSAFEENLNDINEDLNDELTKAEEALRKAQSAYEQANKDAKDAASDGKSSALGNYEKVKSIFDGAKNNLLGAVPVVKPKVEEAHISNSLINLKNKIDDIVCVGCELKN